MCRSKSRYARIPFLYRVVRCSSPPPPLSPSPTPPRYTGLRTQSKHSDRSPLPVADKFDPYREALVMETETIWPTLFDDLPKPEKVRLEQQLHADPGACGQLDYV